MDEFLYNGKRIFELPSVTGIKEPGAQLKEIEARVSAMYQYCKEHGISFTEVDIRAVLGIDTSTLDKWISQRPRKRSDNGCHATSLSQSRLADDVIALYIARAGVFKKFLALGEQDCLHTIDTTKGKPTGAMFKAKACFRYQEYEKEAAIGANSGIEIIIKAGQEKKRGMDKIRDKMGQ